jgi:HAMP domain-containing protein
VSDSSAPAPSAKNPAARQRSQPDAEIDGVEVSRCPPGAHRGHQRCHSKQARHDAYVTFLGILVAIFALVVLILNILLHYLVIAPVKKVSAMADAVSMGDESVEPYVKSGNDEISSLSVSFNRMRESLRHAMDMIK